jgi:23S rRNA (cytidine1920-2'-O)/16S rRNA (cytidine1409-2'-O)-methyltransferase
MRLDKFLISQNYVESREKAKFLIVQGLVKINGKVAEKVAYKVKSDDIIDVDNDDIFVSRSGNKLEAAIKEFNLDVKNYICLDIGASTGGFTDCLLRFGAKKVYTVDVGTDQLHPKLRNNNRVICYEEADFREFDRSEIEENLDIIVIDVSFISIKEIFDHISPFLNDKIEIIALYKPQFEVGKGNIKKGIANNDEIVQQSIEEFKEYIEKYNLQVADSIKSPLKGKEGNQEYLLLILPR